MVQVANVGVVTMTGKVQIESNKKKKAVQHEIKMKRDTTTKTIAEDAFKKYVTAGMPETLPAKDSNAILKFVVSITKATRRGLCNIHTSN